MGELKIDDVLAMECKSKATHSEVNSMLQESGISADEYNSYILGLLSGSADEHPPVLQTESLIDDRMKQDILDARGSRIAVKDHSAQIKQNLEAFYNVDRCPSFIYNEAMLADEDYDFFLEIYSRLFSLEPVDGQEMAEFLNRTITAYATGILEGCDENTTVEMLREMLEK